MKHGDERSNFSLLVRTCSSCCGIAFEASLSFSQSAVLSGGIIVMRIDLRRSARVVGVAVCATALVCLTDIGVLTARG